MAADFLVIGHVVQDLVPGAWRLGGTAAYASLLAARLGLRVEVVTAAGPDVSLPADPNLTVHRLPGEATTQIRNLYDGQRRVQYIPRQAPPITAEALPDDATEAGIVLLGPVAGDVDMGLTSCFPSSLLGVSVQGWLREIAPDARVRPVPPGRWPPAGALARTHALFVSDEDLAPEQAQQALEGWSRAVPVVAFTRGERGAEVCHRGEWRHIEAFPAESVDPTGAGDIFAAAFLIRLKETGDVWESARFAACAASFVVEAEGTAGLPTREMIEARLARHPGIVCRRA